MLHNAKITKRRPAVRDSGVRADLLAGARRLFAAKGFEGASLKELAEQTGHNAALVSYYFESKEGLFRECVLPLLGAGMASAEATLRPAKCRADLLARFAQFVENFIATHLAEQDICIILHRDLHTNVVRQLFKDHVQCFDDHLLKFLKSARKCNLIRSDIDPDLLAKMIMSSMFNLISIDRFRSDLGEPAFLSESRRVSTVRQITDFFVSGFVNPQP